MILDYNINTPGDSITNNEVLDQILKGQGSSLNEEKEKIAAAKAAEKAEKERLAEEARKKAELERVRAIDLEVLKAFDQGRLLIAIDGELIEPPKDPEGLHTISCPCGTTLDGMWELLKFAVRSGNRTDHTALMHDNAEIAPSTLVYTVHYRCPTCGKDLKIAVEARKIYPDGYRGMMLELAGKLQSAGPRSEPAQR